MAPPRTRKDSRARGIHRREVAPELEDDLEDPERDDEEHELVELEGPDDEHIKAPAHAQQTRRDGERSEEASRAASSLVWSKRDDGSSTLISVPFNVDGTRGEAPQDAEEWISEDATLAVGIGIFALYVLGLACYLRRSPPFVGRGIPVVTLKEPITLVRLPVIE